MSNTAEALEEQFLNVMDSLAQFEHVLNTTAVPDIVIWRGRTHSREEALKRIASAFELLDFVATFLRQNAKNERRPNGL